MVYLSLVSPSSSLSGEEAQRVKMIRQLGSSLTDVTYVFDEPTSGLHPHDIQRMNEFAVAAGQRKYGVRDRTRARHEVAARLAASEAAQRVVRPPSDCCQSTAPISGGTAQSFDGHRVQRGADRISEWQGRATEEEFVDAVSGTVGG